MSDGNREEGGTDFINVNWIGHIEEIVVFHELDVELDSGNDRINLDTMEGR